MLRSAAAGARIWLVLLSLFDAAATDVGIRLQLVREGNPFAGAIYETNIALFYAFKLLLPLVLLLLLRRLDERSFVHKGVLFATGLYGCVALYHLFWMTYAMR